MVKLIFSSQSKMALAALKKELDSVCPERNEYNFISFDMGNTSIEELVRECETPSLCFDSKVVVAENCFFLDKTGEGRKKKKDESSDLLLNYVLKDDPSTTLYLLLYSEVVDLTNPIIKAIHERKNIREVKNMDAAGWKSYIKSYFEKRSYKIDFESCDEIYERTSGDYASFINEASKLMSYKLDEKSISLDDVKTMIAPKVESDTFLMSNQLMKGDISGAIKTYKDLKLHSIDEITLIGMLATNFIFMDKVNYLYHQGFDNDSIAQELGLKNPKRVFVTINNLRKTSEEGISKILEQLYEADASILAGEVSQEFAFSRFLANFSF